MAKATSALLIGSCICEPYRDLRCEGKRVDKKNGIRRAFTKPSTLIPRWAWVKGDLDNMENMMNKKNIELFYRLEYRERDDDGRYALGKTDVLRLISDFFSQEEKTHFILYFSGNGDQDGSWVFPVTTLFIKRVSIPKEPAIVAENKIEVEVHRDGLEHPSPTPDSREHSSAFSESSYVLSRDSRTNLYDITRAQLERPAPVREWNDLVKYEDVIKLWDEHKKGRERYLMMILDCCHSGRWVQKFNGDFESCDSEETYTYHQNTKRQDICIQASCRPAEICSIAENQLSSVFTKAFVAAQNRSTFEKCILSLLDHIFVINVVSMACSRREHFTPISSQCAPFAGIIFFDSFDDMYLQT